MNPVIQWCLVMIADVWIISALMRLCKNWRCTRCFEAPLIATGILIGITAFIVLMETLAKQECGGHYER